jgi:hypothetical protein
MDGIQEQVNILNGEKSRKGDEAAAAAQAKEMAEAEANAGDHLTNVKKALEDA